MIAGLETSGGNSLGRKNLSVRLSKPDFLPLFSDSGIRIYISSKYQNRYQLTYSGRLNSYVFLPCPVSGFFLFASDLS